MSAQGVHRITEMFEQELCRYTGAPLALAIDNCSNAIGLCLMLFKRRLLLPTGASFPVAIPSRTYVSIPNEIRLAGLTVEFYPVESETLTGAYRLDGTNIWDSALHFTADMYLPGQMMCLSFTGPTKILKLGKGGAILLDDPDAYEWLKKARNSGRSECSYMVDNFTMLGHNYYMAPQIAAQGLLLMAGFYNADGSKKHNEDICNEYPDLSKFPIFTQ